MKWNYWLIQQFETEIGENYFHISQMIRILNFSSRKEGNTLSFQLRMLKVFFFSLPEGDLKTRFYQSVVELKWWRLNFFCFEPPLACYPVPLPTKMTEGWPVTMVTTPHSVPSSGTQDADLADSPVLCMNGCLCEGKSFWRLGWGGGRQRGLEVGQEADRGGVGWGWRLKNGQRTRERELHDELEWKAVDVAHYAHCQADVFPAAASAAFFSPPQRFSAKSWSVAQERWEGLKTIARGSACLGCMCRCQVWLC